MAETGADRPTEDAGLPPGTEAPRRSAVKQFALALLVVLAITALLVLASPRPDGGVAAAPSIRSTPGALARVGESAPEVSAPDLDGKIVRLSDYRGKPVWISFWATWCPPCRAEIPEVQAAYLESRDHDVVLLAISSGEAAGVVSSYVERAGISYPVLTDPDGSVAARYRLPGFPTHYFIDRAGILREIRSGGLDKAGFLRALEPLLGRGS